MEGHGKYHKGFKPTVYLYIRSVAEQSCVVWSSSITVGEEYDLERIQKVALRIILHDEYRDYEYALKATNLKTLKERRLTVIEPENQTSWNRGVSDLTENQVKDCY